jgi:uncharacterized tellurite resistance protein B-like protein
MSIVTRFLSVVTEPQFKLARDLTAMAIADGKVTEEEKEAISVICRMEDINESQLYQNLQGSYDQVEAEMPKERQERVMYLKELIRLIGADKYAAPQEVYLFQIIAGRMGLNQMEVMGLFLSTANRRYFEGDTGAKIFHSFLKNHIDPKSKKESENRANLRCMYETVACNTEHLQDIEADRELLRQNLERAMQAFLENKILIKEFSDMKLDFPRILQEEAQIVFKKYM